MIAALLGAALTLSPLPPAARADTLADTVFVVSNRRRAAHDFTREATDSLWYGLYVTRTVGGDGASRVLAPLHVTRVDSTSLDATAWRGRLAAAVRDTAARNAVLLYVHGYASNPRTALAQGVQVKVRGAHRGPLVVFLWPAHGMGVAVPAAPRAYHDDARAAARSGPALAAALRAIDSLAPGAVLVAHSMGTRVALDAVIGDTAMRARLAARPLRAVGIFSPDVGAERFRAEYAPRLPGVARRVAVYGASTDYLLGAAVLMNGERRASGITRRGAALAGIELVDVTRGARAEPRLLTMFGPRHSVRWAGAALADFFGIVVSGADPSCRVTAATADADGDGRWRLRRRATLPDWLGAGCAPVRDGGR